MPSEPVSDGIFISWDGSDTPAPDPHKRSRSGNAAAGKMTKAANRVRLRLKPIRKPLTRPPETAHLARHHYRRPACFTDRNEQIRHKTANARQALSDGIGRHPVGYIQRIRNYLARIIRFVKIRKLNRLKIHIMTHTASKTPKLWAVIAAAAFILLITIGMRMTLGLFVQPVVNTTELSIARFSLIIAVFQLMWGVSQPLSGALADRFGAFRVLSGGAVLLVCACLIAPNIPTYWGLMIAVGLLLAFGTGSGGFSIIMGQVAAQIPAHRRGLASGLVNAGGSAGQFLFAPLVQGLTALPQAGWTGTFYVWAGIALLILPAARLLAGKTPACGTPHTHIESGQTLRQALKTAFKNPGYLLLHLGFFTCGFHIAFLVTHLPTEIALCGLPATVASTAIAIIGLANIAGCIFSGWCTSRIRGKYVLFWLYASRAAMVLVYIFSPKTDFNFYIFAAALGFTWLATVTPTASITGKLFGTRYLATLFGLTMLSHQIGGFLGSYIGGIVITQFGDYGWMWYADALLAGTAALLNLPIREPETA